jgi:hypothetical protein
LDIYEPLHRFDEFVRGVDINIFKESLEEKPFFGSNLSNINSKKDELINRINEVYEAERRTLTNDELIKFAERNEMTIQASSNLNQSAIVQYARNNFNKLTPSSGGQNVPYYDFSQIPGNYDCTNFVSHALLAGGAQVYDTGGSGISSTGWYYRNLSNRSSSWSGVVNLYNFLISNTTKGPGGNGVAYHTQSPISWQNGDVLQFYSSSYGNWRHSTIITATHVVQQTPIWIAKPVVTGRASASQYNDNILAESIYVGEQKRIVVSLKNYY